MCMLQTLTRRTPVQYTLVSFLKACRNHLSQAPPPPPQTCPPAAAASLGGEVVGGSLKRYENPCLDLYFNVITRKPATFVHLNRLLPPSWSHNPLTTLKIIRSYDEQFMDLTQMEVFNKAVYWLYHNHPKTLAFNLPYLVSSRTFVAIYPVLYSVLDMENVYSSFGDHEIGRFREAIDSNPDFRFLHDRISDLFAESLKFDIQNLNNHDHDDEEEGILEVTDAAESIYNAPFMLESVAKRVFPGVEDAVDRLKTEVLEPLNKVLDYKNRLDMNRWGYRLVHDNQETPHYLLCGKYLKEVKESPDKMVADALVPHQIVGFVQNGDLRQVVELQWKIMVEDMKKKYKEKMQGILSNCLGVVHLDKYSLKTIGEEVAMSLTILMSELSEEEAWKGKFIPLIPKPRLLLIQGDDLKSKCEFLREGVFKDEDYASTDFKMVFDLILQEAVDRGLKPEQMIRRIYVFTLYQHEGFEVISSGSWPEEGLGNNEEEILGKWQVHDYEEMKNKYKDHGYDMPHIVFWKIGDHLEPVQQSPDQRGIITISTSTGLVDANFVKMLLENDGEMSPQHVMEANLSHIDHPLAVLD